MRITYKPLFHVRLRHDFYTSGESVGDLRVEPSAATRRLLDDHGLVFRPLGDGWAVYGRIEPEIDPTILLQPLGDEPLRFAFLLRPAHRHLWNISDLPEHRPGRGVFAFDNLREDEAAGRLHLGDSVAVARVGPALRLVTASIWTYDGFAAPITTAELTIRDRFGAVVFTQRISLSESVEEVRVDLDSADRLPPGRYTLEDGQGGSEAFYYDPEIFENRPFGVVEIFSHTDAAPDVPAAYQFLDGDELTPKDYAVQLEPRSTIWRYHVIRKYSEVEPDPNALDITGPVAFNKTVDTDRAVFNSTTAVALGESRQALVLDAPPGTRIRDLPNPTATTPLEAGAAPGSYVSVMYVYV